MGCKWIWVLGVVFGASSVFSQQLDPSAELMKSLTEVPGPSGFEALVR